MTELWEILVPCQFNDGRPVRTRHHKAWDDKVMRVSGGLTVLKPGQGTWQDSGATYKERMIPVRIMCDKKGIERIASITMLHYEQLAVFYYRISDHCVVAEAPDHIKAKFRRENKIASDS